MKTDYELLEPLPLRTITGNAFHDRLDRWFNQ